MLEPLARIIGVPVAVAPWYIPASRELRVAAVRHVVVVGERHVREADRLEVERGHHLVDAGHATVSVERTGVELRAQERRAGEHAGQAQQGFAAGQAVPPAIVRSAQESSAAFARRHITQLPRHPITRSRLYDYELC
jgi:hypothetical protein